MPTNWYTLRSDCEDFVAREIARTRLPANFNKSLDFVARANLWNQIAREALPDAREKINAMTNLQLIELLAEVMGAKDA